MVSSRRSTQTSLNSFQSVPLFAEEMSKELQSTAADWTKNGDEKSTARSGEDPELEVLREYFSKLSIGSPDAWDDVEPMLEEVFHPNFVMVAADREVPYLEFRSILRDFVRTGSAAHLLRFRRDADGTVRIAVRNVLPGEDGEVVEHLLHYRDGKMIWSEAVERDAHTFKSLIDRTAAMSDEPRIAAFRRCLDQFNGKPDAWARAKGMFNEIFDPSLVFVMDRGEKGIEEYREFVQDVAKSRTSARLVGAVKTSEGFDMMIENTVAGEVFPRTVARLTYNEGGLGSKIIRHCSGEGDAPKLQRLMSAVSSLARSTEQSMDELIQKLRQFQGCFDGSSDAWSRASELIAEVYSPDLVVVSDKGVQGGYDWWKSFAKSVAESGTIVRLEDIKQITDSGFIGVFTNIVDDVNTGRSEQKYMVECGRIVRGESVPNDKNFGNLVANVASCMTDDPAERFCLYMEALDGSPGAYGRAKPLLERCFSEDLTIVTTADNHDYKWFLSFMEAFASNGCTTKIEELTSTPGGIVATIRNTVDGKDLGTTKQRGVVDCNGKFVFWEAAAPEDDEGFANMIDSAIET